MNWKMLDLGVRGLNPSALKDWKSVFDGMSAWMQAIMVGALVLLILVSILSCWWGLKMTRSARFAFGAASVFHITMVLLTVEYDIELSNAMIYAAIAGAGAGFLYAFLERVFQFVAGFFLGTVLSAYVLPKCFHLKMTSGSGRIWALVIAIAAGIVFALLAKKLKWVITALEGGVMLGLLCDAYLPVNKIPWVNEKLTDAQIHNLLPLVIAATGVLIQLFQMLAIRAEQKALAIPTGDERNYDSSHEQTDAEAAGQPDGEPEDEDTITMVQAEEVLVEKAKELALAATRSAEQARLKERYEDVVAGLYDTKVAAERLGMSEEAFVRGMKKAGYTVPGTENGEADESADEAGTSQMSETEAAEAETSEAENTETEVAEAETSEAENTETEAAEGDASEAENTETEAAEGEASEAENTETEAAEGETSEAENPETEITEDEASTARIKELWSSVDAMSDPKTPADAASDPKTSVDTASDPKAPVDNVAV